jgi:hypothetical protein
VIERLKLFNNESLNDHPREVENITYILENIQDIPDESIQGFLDAENLKNYQPLDVFL